MKDDAVIKDNEAVYLLNEQTYLHLRENLQGVGYEVFDKNSPLPVEEGQIPREALGNTQRRIETARALSGRASGRACGENPKCCRYHLGEVSLRGSQAQESGSTFSAGQ